VQDNFLLQSRDSASDLPVITYACDVPVMIYSSFVLYLLLCLAVNYVFALCSVTELRV